MNDLKGLIKRFLPFAQEKMGFSRPPKLFLRQDAENGADPLGKTGFYDPQAESITLFVSERHPKDILRSLAHELMHHTQKCNGDFDNAESQGMGEQGYAQNNAHMRTMEIQAYQASIVFRDWEDSLKETIYYEHLQKGDKTMSIKEWKDGEMSTLLTEKWGFKFNLDKLNEGPAGLKEQGDEAWGAPGPFSGELPARRKCLDAGYESESVEYMRCMKKLGIKDPGGASLSGGGKIGPVQPGDLQEDSGEEDWGMGKDEESRTRPGQEDYTGHKGDESATHPGKEDYTGHEGDEDHDEDHDEDLEGKANRVLADLHDVMTAAGLNVNITGGVDDDGLDVEEEEEELEERRGRGRDREGMEPDNRRRPMKENQLSEAQLRRIAAKVAARLKEAKKNG